MTPRSSGLQLTGRVKKYRQMRFGCLIAAVAAVSLISAATASGDLGDPKSRALRMAEKNLIKDLLKEYDKKSRPVIDDDPADGGTPKIDRVKEKGANETIPIQQVTVEFGLRLVQILDLDEMEQVLTTSMIALYEWTDYHLRWDPKNESGIEVLHIPTKLIWLPDIALYNYADERLEERRDVAAKVHSNGKVEWHPMAIYKSACEIRIKYFPFDIQNCDLKFGPWTYDGWRVNITYYHQSVANAFDLSEMNPSPEWRILNYSAVYSSVVYPCCPEPFVDITFSIRMKRSTAFYTFILILPCFLLSSLTLVLFWLPPETPAKMVLGMNIFVAFFLLMLLLEKQTPAASDSFPRIGQYYCLNMGIITLSTFLCVIVVNFHFRGDNRQEVPHWLKKLAIQHGARLLCVNLSKKPPPQPQQPQQQSGTVQLKPRNDANRQHQPHGKRNSRGAAFSTGGAGGSGGGVSRPEELPMHPTSVGSGGGGGGSTAILSPGHATMMMMMNASSGSNQHHYHGHDLQQQQQQQQQQFLGHNSTGSRHQLDDKNQQLAYLQQQHQQGPSSGSRGFHNDQQHQQLDEVLLQCLPRQMMQQQQQLHHLHQQQQQQQQQQQFQQSGITEEVFLGGVLDAATRRRINMLTKDVQDIVKALRYIQKLHENREKVNKIVQEWRSVGLVLDRLFFVVYFLIIAASSIGFFSSGEDGNASA